MVHSGHFLSIPIDRLMAELSVPDAEQHAAKMAGVIEVLPAQEQAADVERQKAEQCVLGGEGEHRQKDERNLQFRLQNTRAGHETEYCSTGAQRIGKRRRT